MTIKNSKIKSFTLIELLIVIAILALLMSIIIITLNPSEILKQTRDTKRISNLKSINNALSIFQATKPTTSTGTANIVYISIPDSASDCINLGLPALPGGYTYACSSLINYRKTDGTGWIPVNFDSLDIGSPLSSLPIDPTNTTSTGLYYVYVTGGSWELSAVMESVKFGPLGDEDKTSTDGGDLDSIYEIGTDFTLAPFRELVVVSESTPTPTPTSTPTPTPTPTPPVVLLHFDGINASTTFTDESGKVWTANGGVKLTTTAPKFGSANGLFVTGNSGYISTPTHSGFELGAENFTIDFWLKWSSTQYAFLFANNDIWIHKNWGNIEFWWWNGSSMSSRNFVSSISQNTWTHIAIIRYGDYVKVYINGSTVDTGVFLGSSFTFRNLPATSYIGGFPEQSGHYLTGYIDEFRFLKGTAMWTTNFTPPTAAY